MFNINNSLKYSRSKAYSQKFVGRQMVSHEVDYKLIGSENQILVITLDPGETVVAEAGALNFMEDGIKFEAKMGDGSRPKSSWISSFFRATFRNLAGEKFFFTHFTNESSLRKKVGFAAPFPGNIIPINLSEVGGSIYCQKEAFLCAAKGTNFSIALAKSLGGGFFGGEGFILQKLTGDGLVFLHAGGNAYSHDLSNGRIKVETGSLVAFTKDIDYNVTIPHTLSSMLFGGENLFFANLEGTGKVIIQSSQFSKVVDRIAIQMKKNVVEAQQEQKAVEDISEGLTNIFSSLF